MVSFTFISTSTILAVLAPFIAAAPVELEARATATCVFQFFRTSAAGTKYLYNPTTSAVGWSNSSTKISSYTVDNQNYIHLKGVSTTVLTRGSDGRLVMKPINTVGFPALTFVQGVLQDSSTGQPVVIYACTDTSSATIMTSSPFSGCLSFGSPLTYTKSGC